MTAPSWQRAKDVFQAARTRSPEMRRAYLDEACGDDTALRGEVESLLAYADAGGFLSRPPSLHTDPGEEASEAASVGRRIGPYRIVSMIARGGMGTVYRAVRDDDSFQKTVALKLVRGGYGSEFIERRFRQERQILARLQHANIATVFDGGTTDEGQPYLVMEHVEGCPITEYAAAHGLGVRERLNLFLIVCGAVQYAHQNLVIHRDLKPDNILVTADGVPKLLDFGIAKLLAAGVDPDEAPTATLLPMLTPEYASPEQVTGAPVTTASDVYSLGMLLYELLAGQRPYEVNKDSLAVIVRAVCDTEPKPPSLVVASAGTRAPDAMGPLLAASELRGDLDTIVLKALRKEPERRFSSVHDFADDLRRHLEGLPVLARADTLGYRAGKFAGRHRVVVAATGLVIVSLVGGVLATLRQARVAEANRLQAERRFDDVRKLANEILFEFHDAIRDLPGSTKARELLIKRSLEYLDGLASDARGDVGLQREVAAAYQRLGDVQGGGGEGNLGDTKGALASYEKALEIWRTLGVSASSASDVEGMAYLEMKLSRLLVLVGDWQRAEETAGSAATRFETLHGRAGQDLRGRLASLYHTLGFIQARRGKQDLALPSLRKAVSAGQAFSGAHPDDRDARASLARIQADLVERLEGKEPGQALHLSGAARAALEELVQAEPNNARYKRDLIYVLNIGSGAREASGDAAQANRDRRRALELSHALLAADPRNQGDRIALSYALHLLGAGLLRSGEVQEGLERLREAAGAAGGLVKQDPSAFARNRLAEIRAELGLALHKLGIRSSEACAALRDSVALWTGLKADGQLPGEVVPDFEQTRTLLASCPAP